MKSRGTYILLALFFASLVSLWWADFARIPTRRQVEQMSARILPELINSRPDDLQKIEILGGKEPLVFVRHKDGVGWQMTSPMDVEADPSKVETLAYNLKELSRKPEAATLEGDPSRFGLTPPEQVIRLWGSQSAEPIASLDLGLENEKLGRRYVRATGSEGVEVVDSKGLALLKLLTIRWRDHELFRVPSFEIDGVSLKSGGRELKLKRGRDAWRLEAPIKTLATDAKVDGVIADLGSLRVVDDTRFIANDVKADDLERYGLKNPVMTIEVDAGRASNRRPPQILHVGKPVEGKEGQVYVRRDGQDDVLAVDSRVLKGLKIDPNLFRSPKVADLKTARVSKIAVEEPGGGFELVKNGSDWSIVRPSPLKADRKAVEDFLKSLDKLETNIFRSPGSIVDSGLDKSAMVLKIWQSANPREAQASAGAPNAESADADSEPVLSLRIGRRDGARRAIYAQLEGDSTVLALPESAHEFLPRNVLAFRDHQVLSEAIEPIQRITLIGGTRKFVINSPPLKLDPFRKAPLGWWMVEPVDAPADPPTIGVLLRVLAGLRAETLEAETLENLEQYGLKSPILTLSWSSLPRFSMVSEPFVLAPGAKTIPLEERSLLVGNLVPNRPSLRYAKLSDRPLIFTISPEVQGILDTELRDHQVFSFKPDQVKNVRFDWPGRGLDVVPIRDSENTTWSPHSSVDFPDFKLKEINTLLVAVSKLATNRYTQHLGDFPPYTGLNPARLTIRIELDDGSLPRTLRIGASETRGNVFATTETGTAGPVFLLPEPFFRAWLEAPIVNLPENVFAP
jgi:hypothetical protein